MTPLALFKFVIVAYALTGQQIGQRWNETPPMEFGECMRILESFKTTQRVGDIAVAAFCKPENQP